MEIKEELQEITLKEKKHSKNSESDEVEEDLHFLEQSKDTQEMEQLIQSLLVKEKENWINIQKSKPKQTKNLKAVCPNSVELLSENNNNDLEIINKTLEPINKLVNGDNSGNEVTRQFNPDTTKLYRTTINPTIESEVGEIRHKVAKTNTCTTKQIDNKNKVNNCKAVIVQPRNYGKVARRPIRMTTLKYPDLTNFPLRANKKINVRKLKRKQKIALSKAKQLAKKVWKLNVTKSLAATRKIARRQQPKSIPLTEEKDEVKVNNVRRTMETSSETSLSDIEQQLEKDEKTLLQKLKNELSNKQEILLRRQHIKHMREIVQQLEKENVGYKAADIQTGQRQLEITRAINMFYQLKNESTMYEDNFVIKDQAGYDTIQCHVKFTIKDLRPEGYCGPRVFHTMYDLVEDRLTRHIVMRKNDGTQQVEQLPVIEIKPSTSGMADGNKKGLSGKKRKILSSESNFMEKVQISNEKKKKKNKIDISSKALKHATASRTQRNDGKFKPTEEQITTSTNKQTKNNQEIISAKDLNLLPHNKNLQQKLSFEKKIFTLEVMKLPALNPTSTALLKSKEPETGNQLPESQPEESAVDELQNPQIMNNNQAMATFSEEDVEKQPNVEQVMENNGNSKNIDRKNAEKCD